MSTRRIVDEPVCVIKLCNNNSTDIQESKDTISFIQVSEKKSNISTSGGVGESTYGKRTKYSDKQSSLFFKFAGDDEQINPFELQTLLADIFHDEFPNLKNFNLETCRALVASLDLKRTGKLDYHQFQDRWNKILIWKRIFYECCNTKSSEHMNEEELFNSLRKTGFTLDERNVGLIFNKYQNRKGLIQLDDFIQICCRATRAKTSFEKVLKEDSVYMDDYFMEMLYI